MLSQKITHSFAGLVNWATLGKTDTRKAFLWMLLTITSFAAMAQNTLTPSCNQPRTGDRLMKQQIVYQASDEAGAHQLWDFRKQDSLNDHYELKYLSLEANSDTVVGIEHRTMYYYYLKGDSLLSLGYENPTTLIKYRKPETLLVFPFAYGRTFTDYFDGVGRYCERLSIHVQGKSVVTADATGTLILPGGDTLQNVLRVHSQKKIVEQMSPVATQKTIPVDSVSFALNRDSIDWHLANDTTHIQVDTWRWYAEGYRYPIFESIENSEYRLGEKHPYFKTSFYYPPHEQYYGLEDDLENRTARENGSDRGIDSNQSATDKSLAGGNGSTINYGCRMDDDGNLRVDYTVSEDANVTVCLFDLQGRQLSTAHTVANKGGSYQTQIQLSDYPSGEYLLRITVDDQVYGEKIFKH